MSKGLLIAALLYLALASAYVVKTPAFEGPDENDHWFYAWQLANSQAMPVARFTARELGRPVIDEAGLAHHPPLYYALLAGAMELAQRRDTVASQLTNPENLQSTPAGAFLWLHGADEDAPVSREIRFLRLLRLFSVVCGLVTLVATWVLARLAFPRRLAVADVAALLLATMPAFSFHHAVLDNGNLAATFAHAALVVLCAAITAKRFDVRIAIAGGLLLGLCLVTKLTTLALLPLFGVVAAIAVWNAPRRGPAAIAMLVGGVVVAAIAGWFFVRNVQLYGDLLGGAAHERVYASIRVPDGRAIEWLRVGFFPNIFTSLLGMFGNWTVPPHAALVTFGKVIAAVAACGVVFNLVKPRRDARKSVVWALVGAAGLVFLATLHFNLTFRQPQGRYLFPAIGPIAIVLAAGLVRVITPMREAMRHGAGVLFALTLIGVALLTYEKHFVPAFDRSLVRAPPRHASLVSACTARSSPPGIVLRGPDDGARLDLPPRLSWEPLQDPDARYALYVFTPAGRIYFASHEWLNLELEGDGYDVPSVLWDSLPQGEELIWNVRRIADRSRHESPHEMPTGAGRAFVRSPKP
ncbi:MAG: glycosyltransferase family 39 protein [Planctomycetes bacterium]|nr:glycosyltransferase family 39 protein [Planctomycetota bacterium]